MRKCGGLLVIVATFLGLLFVRRQLIKAGLARTRRATSA